MRPLGRFQMLAGAFAGAFGAVWRARGNVLGRVVALKIVHAGHLASEAELERFHREARAAAQLRHPGIVTVHEVTTPEGLPTIVEDFIRGVSLKGGGGYALLVFDLSPTPKIPRPPPVTGPLLGILKYCLNDDDMPRGPQSVRNPRKDVWGLFYQTGQTLLALVVAVFGGLLGRVFADSSP
jgi:serine/threonine protein kinase